MRYAELTQIDTGFLNRVDLASRPQGLNLADLPATVPDPTNHFLLDHARAIPDDRQAVSAVFKTNAAETPPLVRAALSSRDPVQASQALARRLHMAMTHPRTPAGYLAVVRVLHEADQGEAPALALMKIDDDELATSPLHEQTSAGLRIDIDQHGGYLPQVGKKLEKAALLGTNPDGSTEILVVDRQSAMADFWMGVFLQADERLDNAGRTRLIQDLLISLENDVSGELSPADRRRLGTVITGAMQQDTVDVSQLAEALPGTVARESFREAVAASDMDVVQFDLDEAARDRFLRRSRWTGDHSLSVQMEAVAADSHVFHLKPGDPWPDEEAPNTTDRIVVYSDHVERRA